jgi:hypothetical protein
VRKFLHSETGIVWLQYFVAGIAMIPAGAIYVGLSNSVGERKAFEYSVFLAVVIGVIVKPYVRVVLKAHLVGDANRQAIPLLSNMQEQVVYVKATWIGTDLSSSGPYAEVQTFDSSFR